MQEQQAVLFQPQYHSAHNASCSYERLGTGLISRLILDVKSCGVAASVKMWCVFSSFLSEDAEDGEVCYLECEEASGYLIFNREVGCTAFIVWLVVEAICHWMTYMYITLTYMYRSVPQIRLPSRISPPGIFCAKFYWGIFILRISPPPEEDLSRSRITEIIFI